MPNDRVDELIRELKGLVFSSVYKDEGGFTNSTAGWNSDKARPLLLAYRDSVIEECEQFLEKEFPCQCDEIWTSRKLHSPDCMNANLDRCLTQLKTKTNEN